MIKSVLFICKGNWYRSQMAAAIYNKITNSSKADSAGTYAGEPDEPEGQSLDYLFGRDYFFGIMEKNGMNIRKNVTKRLQPEMLEKYDLIISMAEEPFIPDFLKNHKKYIWWEVENPKIDDAETAEKTYNKIFNLVRDLIASNNT